MKSLLVFLAFLLPALPVAAHHSFAVYDFDKQIAFEGTVQALKFRNPHIAMTLKTTDENGNGKLIEFIEGAPANMLVRSGLKPDMIKPGTKITAVGSPLYEDENKFFLRTIRLENGSEF